MPVTDLLRRIEASLSTGDQRIFNAQDEVSGNVLQKQLSHGMFAYVDHKAGSHLISRVWIVSPNSFA
ncbi:protein of unknown function [Cupriavidus neocaledonicus]|uniref:Uncharacterized protein n=1 Tax=Cupriavidus neocaledonicus TaxID=1040979 RepID=A0A375H770_9BURK|nr:protein of unknown function [Cupriavidus neocaledonicus]